MVSPFRDRARGPFGGPSTEDLLEAGTAPPEIPHEDLDGVVQVESLERAPCPAPLTPSFPKRS
jgi:hypothetical protein